MIVHISLPTILVCYPADDDIALTLLFAMEVFDPRHDTEMKRREVRL
jgi:hypothetical protein